MSYTKKACYALMLVLASVQFANAQAILPTSWNFDVAAPTGWSESLGASNTRYANGQSGQACRLDATTDYVLLQFAEEPGDLNYYIKGQNSGITWQGTFTVQESADGVSFSTLHSFVDGAVNAAAFVQFTDAPLSTSRYIRFYFTNKVSGHNLALDEISLAAPVAGAQQEINVTQNSNNIPSGFTYSVGNSVSTIFTIQNLGLTNALQVNGIALSGTNAGDFSITSSISAINALSSETFTLNFNNVGSGSRFCTITIANDDASESSYVINIYAVAGTLATEPTAQAVNLTFPNLVSWDYNVNFSAGSPVAERYVILRKKGSAVTDVPVDGSSYAKGDWIGGSQVVYSGNAGAFNARNIEASTNYHFAVFAVNGPQGFENYLTASPLTGSVTTPGPSTGNFYNGLNHNNANFVLQVTTALNPSNYVQIFYSNYLSTLINNFYVKDTAVAGVSMNTVECQYSGFDYIYGGGFQWWSGQNEGELSREHTYPQSWMPTYFDSGFEDSKEVSDLHNLLPVQQEECNAVRSNYPYGEVVNPSSTYLGTAFGTNAANQQVYEPRASIKGDAARAVMYQSIKNNTSENDFSLPEQISLIIPYGQDEYILKKWHFEDLPDNYEIARNEYIQTQQHNRNAFIDSVLFPCFIRFSNLTKWEPQFTNNNGLLHAIDQGLSYQWLLDGEEIEGANSVDYTVISGGAYSLAVRQFAECPVITSQPITVGIRELSSENFDVVFYPNPSNGRLKMNIKTDQYGPAYLNILDATGRIIWSANYSVGIGESTIDLQLQFPSGIYTAEVIANGEKRVSRIVLQ